MLKRFKRNRQARADRARLIQRLEALREICVLSAKELQFAGAVVSIVDRKLVLAIAQDEKALAEQLVDDLQTAAAWHRQLMQREDALNKDLSKLIAELKGLK